MNNAERFRCVLNFEKPADRLPMVEWAPWWDKTISRWETEGMPPGMKFEDSVNYFGLDFITCIGAPTRREDCPPPPSPERGLVFNEADYEAVLPFLYPDSGIAQLTQRARELCDRHARGEVIVRLWLDGFFWFPRGLFGIENHLFAFYDHPGLMHRINDDLAAFNLKVVEALFPVLKPDMVGFAEDMSYNNGPMLSRDCFNEFLLPYYRRVIPSIRAHGVKTLVDSDGQIEPMIPWLMDAGIEGVYPLERQAGVDVARIRQRHPRFLLMGAYDKMVMSRGETALRTEFERLLPVMKSGGFIPSVDHQTPPGVSFDHYRAYLRLFREYTDKAVRG